MSAHDVRRIGAAKTRALQPHTARGREQRKEKGQEWTRSSRVGRVGGDLDAEQATATETLTPRKHARPDPLALVTTS